MQTYYSDHLFDGNSIKQNVLMSVDNGLIVDIQAGKAKDADFKLDCPPNVLHVQLIDGKE